MFQLSQKYRNARLTPFWVRVRLTVHIFWYILIKFLSLAVLKKIISGPEKVLKKSGISKSWICGSPVKDTFCSMVQKIFVTSQHCLCLISFLETTNNLTLTFRKSYRCCIPTYYRGILGQPKVYVYMKPVYLHSSAYLSLSYLPLMNSMKLVIPLHFTSWKKRPNNAMTPRLRSQSTPKLKANSVPSLLSNWPGQWMLWNDKFHGTRG